MRVSIFTVFDKKVDFPAMQGAGYSLDVRHNFFLELPMGMESFYRNENARQGYSQKITTTENASKAQ